MYTTLPLAEVRERLSPLIASVDSTHERIVITKNGRPVAVLVSVADLESLEETVEVLSDPDLVEDLKLNRTDPTTYSAEEIMAEFGSPSGVAA